MEHPRSVPRAQWSAPTSSDVVHRRAKGRGRYNSVRKLRTRLRDAKMFRRLADYGFARGAQARVAREFGVSPSTVCRVMSRLPGPPDPIRCPLCRAVPLDEILASTATIAQTQSVQQTGPAHIAEASENAPVVRLTHDEQEPVLGHGQPISRRG